MASNRTQRNARRAVARLRSSGKLREVRQQNRSRSGGSKDNSGGDKGGKVGAGPRIKARFAGQINQAAGAERRGKRQGPNL